MANTLTAVATKIFAQGLLALRANSVMPRLVFTDYAEEEAQQGDILTIQLSSTQTVSSVSPGPTPITPGDAVPTSITLELDQWKHTSMHLTDKEMRAINTGEFKRLQVAESMKALGDNVSDYIYGLYKGIFGYAGVAGTTPFSSNTSEATTTRKVLNNQLAPLEPRFMVIDPDAEAKALDLRAFQDASFSGSIDAIVNGQINKKLGFSWLMDQKVPTHTKGAEDGNYVVDDAGNALAVGDTSIVVKTGAGTILQGDILTFAGDTQTYTVITGVAAPGTIVISPGLVIDPGDGAAITFKATHVVNLGFHRDAFALVTRTFSPVDPSHGSTIIMGMDPVTQIPLRLEVTRQNKQTVWDWDILYGALLVRPELAVRLAG